MVTTNNSISLFLLCNLLLISSCARSKIAVEKPKQQKTTEKIVENQDIKSPEKKEDLPTVETPKIIHQSHLADAWYKHDAQKLETELDDYFMLAQNNFYTEADPNAIRALIVPHAGHHYSGLCAATVYQTLFKTKNLYSKDLKNTNISKVIILAPSHTHYFEGVGLPDYTHYQTPLGILPVDAAAISSLSIKQYFSVQQESHATEHAIEVQLPFLQKSVQNFSIVPIIIGHLPSADSIKAISLALKEIIDEHTLLVVSSDFIHHGTHYNYTPFKKHISGQVRYIDSLAIQAITAKSQTAFEKVFATTQATICGQNPLKILLYLLEEEFVRNITPRLTCYYTSAHMSVARQETSLINIANLFGTLADDKVPSSVSYVGMILTQQNIKKLSKENQLTEYEKKALVKLAREVIENELKPTHQRTPEHLLWPVVSPGLESASGAFVTLNNREGKLRGCIGQILSYDPLYKTVIKMAKAAAFKDSRFQPLKGIELNNIVLDVSILTAPSKTSAFEEITIGKHGIILNKFEKDGTLKASSVFLPSVPEQHKWDLRTTLEQLSIKAGIGKDGWQEGAELQTFESIEIHEDTLLS